MSAEAHIPNEYIPVKKEITSKTSYKWVVESAQRREKILQEFVQFVTLQCNSIKIFSSKINDNNFILFNDYINDSLDLINQCLGDELTKLCNTNLKRIEDVTHNPEYQQSLPLECTVYQAQKFQNLQEQLLNQIKQQTQQIQIFFDSSEKYTTERQKTLNFFNPNYLKEPYVQMSKLYYLIQQTDLKNKKLINKLQKSKIKFLSLFGNFRKVAVRNRYLFQKKFSHLCGVLVQGVIKMFSQLLKRMKESKQKLQVQMNITPNGTPLGSALRQQKIEFFNKISCQQLFCISSWLRETANLMHQFLTISRDERMKFNKRFCAVSKVQDSFPSHTLNFVLETFEKMFSRFTQIANNLHQKSKILEEQQARLVNSENHGRSTNISYQSGFRKTKVSSVQRAMTIPDTINGMFDDIIDPLSKLVNWAETSLTKEKKIHLQQTKFNHDITRMSNQNGIEQDVHEQQMWMFQDWKQSTHIKLTPLDKVKNDLAKMKSQIESQKKVQGREVMEAQKCHLNISPSYDKKGILYTYQNCVQFISSEDDFKLMIPYEYINNVKVKLQVFKYNVFLYTPRGRVCFINPSRAHKCKQKIMERLKNSQDNNNADDDAQGTQGDDVNSANNNAPKWKSVQLTPGQLSGMQARKTKVKSEMPDITNWHQVHSPVTFRNISIDQFYFELYSDSPKQIGGKKWQSFNQYLVETLGNKQVQDGKFSPKGPKFYNQQDGLTFQNCESFSERTNNYQHPISGFPIPFMPKFCKCKQIAKIYWISNQEFALLIDAYSSGIALTDSFYVRFIHNIKKKGPDIEVQYHAIVVFVKDTSFKNMLDTKCIQEVKDNLPKTIKFQMNRLKAVASASGGKGEPEIDGTVLQSPTVKPMAKQESSSSATDKSSMSNLNIMYLVGGVIGFLIIIKLLKILIK